MVESTEQTLDLSWRAEHTPALLAVAVAGLLAGLWACWDCASQSASAQMPVHRDRVAAAAQKIDPNTASAASLNRLALAGPARVQEIVTYRQSQGDRPFHTIKDMEKVHSIGPGFVERNRDELDLPE